MEEPSWPKLTWTHTVINALHKPSRIILMSAIVKEKILQEPKGPIRLFFLFLSRNFVVRAFKLAIKCRNFVSNFCFVEILFNSGSDLPFSLGK